MRGNLHLDVLHVPSSSDQLLHSCRAILALELRVEAEECARGSRMAKVGLQRLLALHSLFVVVAPRLTLDFYAVIQDSS